MNYVIYCIITAVVVVIAYFLGLKLTPTQIAKLELVSTWAYKFVVSLKNTSDESVTGEQKKAQAIELIREYAKKIGLTLTDEQIGALIEDAYDTMKKGQLEQTAKAPTTSS